MSSMEAMQAARDWICFDSDLSDLEIIAMLDAAIKAAQTERVIYPKRDRLPDDERKALDAMVSAMSEKLYRKYIEGYSGFEGASEEHLNRLLHEHLLKGDPVDVANFCAFLLHNGQRVRLSPERVSVPREPTPEMWDAAWNSIGLPYRAKLSMHEIKTLFDKFHSAMLAAAPKEAR